MKSISRLKRAAAIVGVGALAIGGAVLGSGIASAAPLGTQLGALSLTPGSGNTTGTAITYNSTACPTGFTGSGVVRLVDPTTGATTSISTVNSGVAAPFSGSLTTNVLANTLATNPNFADLGTNGTEAEIVVLCASGSGLSGNAEYVQDSYLIFNGNGTTYQETNTPPAGPPVSVTVALAASANPATVGQAVTLTATVTPSNATGTIQFQDNGTNINTTPAPISGGVANTSFTPSAVNAAGEQLTAIYTPSGNFTAAGPGTLSLPIQAAPLNSGQIPLAVVVPASGTFTVTIPTSTWVVLNVNVAGTSATAPTGAITVTDTRNTYPGWSVSGQSTAFSGTIPSTPAGFPAFSAPASDHATQSIPADQLGWVPTNAGALPQGVTLGSTVAAGTNPGLGDSAQVLASVHAGTGNGFTGAGGVVLGANLTLAIPAGQEAGPYAGFLNITSVSSLP
jgi:hypothetical protein